MPKPKKVEDEIRILYTAVLNDIQFIKKQQVEITNYVVVGLVAVASFFSLLLSSIEFKHITKYILGNFLGLVSLIITAIGIWYINGLEKELKASRMRKRTIILDHFTEEFRDILNFRDSPNTVGFFYTAIGLGELLVIIFLCIR